MPVAIPFIAVAAGALATAGATAAGVAAIAATIIGVVVSSAISIVGSMVFSGGSKDSNTSSSLMQPSDHPRDISVRSSIAPREIVIGKVRKGGVIVHVSANGATLFAVFVLAGHQVHRIGPMYINGQIATDENGSGVGKYTWTDGSPLIHSWKKTGNVNGPFYPGDATYGWSQSDQLNGCAAIVVAFSWEKYKDASGFHREFDNTWTDNPFLNFDLSQCTWDVEGLDLIYDPRTGLAGYTTNAALVVAWYLTDPIYGLHADWTNEIDQNALIQAANICDENVATLAPPLPVVAYPANYQLVATNTPGAGWGFFTGDQVTLSSSGAVPTGLIAGQIYYWIERAFTPAVTGAAVVNQAIAPSGMDYAAYVTWWNSTHGFGGGGFTTILTDILLQSFFNDFAAYQANGNRDPAALNPSGGAATTDMWTGSLAATLADARAGNPVPFFDAGSGSLVLQRAAEARYEANGVVSCDQPPSSLLPAFLSALGGSGGRAIYSGGRWVIRAAAYSAPVGNAITFNDLRKDGFSILPQSGRRDYCNGVRGRFINPAAAWTEDDYPPISNDTLVALDGGQQAWLQLNLPFEISSSRAQRIASIELLRSRLETQIPQLPLKLNALGNRVGDTVTLTIPRYGWTNVIFEVIGWALAREADDSGASILGVDLSLRQTDPLIYSWSAAQAANVPMTPPSDLPDPIQVLVPGVPTVVESIFVSSDGTGARSKVTITVARNDPYAIDYQFGYLADSLKSSTGISVVGQPLPVTLGIWIDLPTTIAQSGDPTVSIDLNDVPAGIYDFRARCINRFGNSSSYSLLENFNILALSAPPVDVTGFSVTPIAGFAYTTWDLAPDLDVRFGGFILIRFSPSLFSATWMNASDWGPHIDGNQTHATLPLSQGTYMAKYVDSTGQESNTAASVSVQAPDLISYAGGVETDTESPTFGGIKTGCFVDVGLLKMVGTGLWDDIPNFDAVVDLDLLGGIVSHAEYDFAAGIDVGAPLACRILTQVDIEGVAFGDLFDSRLQNVDDWINFDGIVDVSSISAQMYYRSTFDDPLVAPRWSNWSPILGLADVAGQAFEFKLTMDTSDTAYGVWVRSLTASVYQTDIAVLPPPLPPDPTVLPQAGIFFPVQVEMPVMVTHGGAPSVRDLALALGVDAPVLSFNNRPSVGVPDRADVVSVQPLPVATAHSQKSIAPVDRTNIVSAQPYPVPVAHVVFGPLNEAMVVPVEKPILIYHAHVSVSNVANVTNVPSPGITGGVQTTWDPANKFSINLSNGNLTATFSGGSFANCGVRSTTSRASGRVYFEIHADSETDGTWYDLGFGTSLWNLNQAVSIAADPNAICYRGVGDFAANNAQVVTGLPTFGNGDVISFAVDIDNRVFWAAKNGSWVNGSPGINGGTPYSFTGAIFAGFAAFSTGDAVTANFGASAFAFAPPATFTGWDASAVPAVAWSAVDKAAGITLSNGNLTATATSGATIQGVRSSTSVASGKFYFEITNNATSGPWGTGISNSRWSVTTNLGSDLNSFSIGQDSSAYINGVQIKAGGGPYIDPGHTVGVAIDFGVKQFWFRIDNGAWVTADPAVGAGLSFASLAAGPYFVSWADNVPGGVTVNLGASAFVGTAPTGFLAWNGSVPAGGGGGGTGTRPAAIAAYPTWTQKANWDFGTNTGNNIKKLSDLVAAGWHASDGAFNVNSEVQTFPQSDSQLTDTNPCFQPQADYCDIVAVWNGGPLVGGAANGNCQSLQIQYPVDLNLGMRVAGYYEGTFKCYKVSGLWPAWWTTSHTIGSLNYFDTPWGPEIDILEMEPGDQTTSFGAGTLHAANNSSNNCFLGGAPAINAPPATAFEPHTRVFLDFSGFGNIESFLVNGFIDSASGFHRWGCLIEPNFNITIYIDDVKIGTYFSTQYCHDDGTPVAVNLLIDLAMGGFGGPIDTNNFGGVNNAGPTNLMRFAVKKIQIWGP